MLFLIFCLGITEQRIDKTDERRAGLFSIGEYISYGNSGVCEVMGTEVMESSVGNSAGRECYILRPLHDQSCKIMTPVDNQKVIMRNLISPEETKQLLDQNLEAQADAFKGTANSILQEVRNNGSEVENIRIVVYYNYGDYQITTATFESDPVE